MDLIGELKRVRLAHLPTLLEDRIVHLCPEYSKSGNALLDKLLDELLDAIRAVAPRCSDIAKHLPKEDLRRSPTVSVQ